jgi:hypothetical protein
MANITEILGTDSVSSSRPIINSNFELLNDELASVIALLNPTTFALSGLASISTTSLIVFNGSTQALQVNNNAATFGVDSIFNKAAKLNGTLVKSSVIGSVAVPTLVSAPTSITAITYFVNANFTLPEAVDGSEVTIINTVLAAKTVTAGTGALLGAGSIILNNLNSTVTLRCFNDVWYVIASHAATIS